MAKANILEFFAWTNLIIGGLVAFFFVYRGANMINGEITVLIGVAIFLVALLQFAVVGGMAEIITRLVKIDENTNPRQDLPPSVTPYSQYPKTPAPETAKTRNASNVPTIGRDSRQ